MIPYTYQVMKKFVCVVDGKEFESGSPQARYCSVTCQRRAKAQRRASRDEAIRPRTTPVPEDRFYDSIRNPNLVQLDKYAQMILTGHIDKPVQFFGEVPYWTAPIGIVLAEQFGVEPRQWVMQKIEPANDLMATLLGKV